MTTYVYRPTLRWKRGEKVAVSNLSPAGSNNVIPIFVIASDQFKEKAATKSRPLVTPHDSLADDLATYWGNNQCYVDASSVTGALSLPHPIVAIAQAAYTRGVPLIPATRLSAPLHYQQGVVLVHNAFSCGAALRVDLQGLTSTASWVTSWPIPLPSTDLIVDFEDNIGSALSLGSVLAAAFNGVHGAGNWRSVTICGTSMPDNFGGYAAGLHIIPRQEMSLWSFLVHSISYRLDFGDYATVPIDPASGNIAWGFPINARYSLQNDFLICRGVPTTGYGGVDMDQQLIGHAQSIRGYAGRLPLPHCWGDQKIDQIASLTDGPGNLETWVQIGVNRHIEITRQYLP